jgi:hypothetical protein
MDKFTKYCRCDGFYGGMRIGSDGRLYCTKCGLLIDEYVKGYKEFKAQILEFRPPPKKTDSK